MKTKLTYFTLLVLFVSSIFIFSSQIMASNDWVITQCFAPQGNGGNYAATLGWMSETLQIRVQEAIEIEKTTGQRVKIHLGCMTGGSSGSLSTSILMNILENENLVPGAHADKLFSPTETQIIADALRFMSIGADGYALEIINTYRQVILENIEGKVTSSFGRINFFNNFARNVIGNNTPTWWADQSVDADQILVDFLTTSLLASTMDIKLLYGKMLSEIDYDELNKDAMNDWDYKIHLKRYNTLDEIPRETNDESDFSSAYSDLEAISSEINSTSDKFISSQFKWGAFKSRYWFGPYDASKPIKDIAEKPMGQGFCTISMGIIYDDESEVNLNNSPVYNDIRAIVMCSADTIDSILNQPDFLSDLKDNPFLKKFILVETKNLRGALALSLREPVMMSEFTDKIGSERVEMVSYFDPTIHSVPRRYKFNGQSLAVLGGWPDRRISAWLISYYLLHNVERFRADGYEVKGYMSMFGKPDNRQKDKFDTRSIKTIFSSSPEEAEVNLANWFEFQDTYCSSFIPRFDSQFIEDETVAFNWDIFKVPATISRNSRFLTTIAIDATQLQNIHSNRKFVFASHIDDGFIENHEAIPCTYE